MSAPAPPAPINPGAINAETITTCDEHVLDSIQRRVLWLATSMVHHANHVRHSVSGLKVGGHQASSASMVSIMTALYFDHLQCADRVSVKPHASPVLHAINYLLGRLEQRQLTELRSFGGLQSYPSRTKDPDPVDFSTGSVGIGATATIWSALAQRYVDDHAGTSTGGRHVALLGDAELDEGAIWEALVDPQVPHLHELLWIVDLNRQSLDRVVPDLAAGRIGRMFAAAGWQTLTVKYGRHLRALFDQPGGDALQHRLDTMSNEEYQRMLRCPAAEVRDRLRADPFTGTSLDRVLTDLGDALQHRLDTMANEEYQRMLRCPAAEVRDRLRADPFTGPSLDRVLTDLGDADLAEAVRDLGGHDLVDLTDAYRRAASTTDRPTVVFAYTIKAWRLPTAGHPANHSALLSPEQWRRLGEELGADPDDPWSAFDPTSPEAAACATVARRLDRPPPGPPAAVDVPVELGRPHAPRGSTQQALGRFLVDLCHVAPHTAERIVTVSPDVASSTNLGAWINTVGVWNPLERQDWFSDDGERLLAWREGVGGQHIELGIAEGNLVGLLAELGATWSRCGHRLLPIGTIYDPFVTRALEPWSFGIYAGGQSILIGTPSGVTLAPEGGAHQSIITPSIGIEQPHCVGWEPCFAHDLEWTLLHALASLGTPGGTSAYFRLSTRTIDQSLAALPVESAAREERRRQCVAGGYPVRRSAQPPDITLVGMGAIMPEVLDAAQCLHDAGLHVDVICLTSADLVFRALRARHGLDAADDWILRALFPPARRSPIVTVLDGHPHTLSFLGSINATATANLGVADFGQAGDIDDLYRHHGIDPDTIVGAAWDLIDGPIEQA